MFRLFSRSPTSLCISVADNLFGGVAPVVSIASNSNQSGYHTAISRIGNAGSLSWKPVVKSPQQKCLNLKGNSLVGIVPFYESARLYWTHEHRIGWRRMREKARRRRLTISDPVTPVVDAKWPLPPNDMEKLPSDYFGERIEPNPEQARATQNAILERVNEQINSKSMGRLFAVVHINGKQFKVTPEDIIVVQEFFPPTVGDQIRLNKVLLVGGKDFSLVGKPLIDQELIRIEATVIEKTLSYCKIHFVQRKNRYKRHKFSKTPYTMLRINLIELMQPLDMIRSDSETFSQQQQQLI